MLLEIEAASAYDCKVPFPDINPAYLHRSKNSEVLLMKAVRPVNLENGSHIFSDYCVPQVPSISSIPLGKSKKY